MGVVLIIVGVLLLTGRFEQMASIGTFFGSYEELALGRMLLILVVALVFLGLIPAFIARKKGRKFLDWWIFGIGLFPIALPMAILLQPKVSEQEIAS